MTGMLRVPCAYQGGKQRIASQVVDLLLDAQQDDDTVFYDLCCGSGAISIELVNRGVPPSRITMLDISSWGAFWKAIGTGTFEMKRFEHFLAGVPDNKREVKKYMSDLASRSLTDGEAELFPILQAASFGGKQIWYDGTKWCNACFRDYWEPTETSVRRSPANPIQPSPKELRRRISLLICGMKGASCLRMDVNDFLDLSLPENAVVYVDPPYRGTTGYAYGFDVGTFIARFKTKFTVPLFVSEGMALSDQAKRLHLGGAKGGITGIRTGKRQEWLSKF